MTQTGGDPIGNSGRMGQKRKQNPELPGDVPDPSDVFVRGIFPVGYGHGLPGGLRLGRPSEVQARGG